MANRTTVKSNVNTKVQPVMVTSVHRDVLNNDFADNIVFKEDVAVTQSSTSSIITCDFTDKDRIDLTRTGGSLILTMAGISDGQVVYIAITKTAGTHITFSNATEVTPVVANVDAASSVLYEIIRKGSNYYARAVIKSPLTATDTVEGILRIATEGEANALTSTSTILTPGTIPRSSIAQSGVCEIATGSEIDAGTNIDGGGDQLVVQPSELKRKYDDAISHADAIETSLTDYPTTWTNLSLETGWYGTLQYKKSATGVIMIRAQGLYRNSSYTGITGTTIASLPSGLKPSGTITFLAAPESPIDSRRLYTHTIYLGLNVGIGLIPEPDNYVANEEFDFFITYIADA